MKTALPSLFSRIIIDYSSSFALRKWILLLLPYLIASSCKEEQELDSHDSNQEIRIDSITPSLAGMAEDLFIYGKNFSTNKQDIRVTINGKEASVISSRMDMIFVVVPKRPDIMGNVIVSIGNKSSNGFPFTYKTSEVVQTFAGTGVSGDVDGASEKAKFNFTDMSGLCLSPTGEVVVADCGNNKIKSISETGQVKTLLSGLSKPMDVIYDKQGNLFFANCDAGSIVRYDVNKKQTVVGTMGWPTGIAYDDVTDKIVAILYNSGDIMAVKDKNAEDPTDTAMETFMTTGDINVSFMRFKDGDLYFTSSNKHAIYVLKKGKNAPEVIAGVPGKKGIITQETQAKEALLTNPSGLDFAPNGDLYFSTGLPTKAASSDNKIYVLRKSDGIIYPLIGKTTAGNADGASSSAMFNSPAALRVDSDNSVYLLDKLNFKVRKVTVQ